MRNVHGLALASLVGVMVSCGAPNGSEDTGSASLGLVGADPPVELRINEGSQDEAFAMTSDGAGNVYVAGVVDKANTSRFAVTKYSRQGARVWTAFHSGPLGANMTGGAKAVAVDPDGNVFATGKLTAVIDDKLAITPILVKFSPTGAELWAKAVSGRLAIDSAGNLLVIGDAVAQKYSPSGALLWERTSRGDGFSTFALDRTDNLIVTGYTVSADAVNEASDVVTIKYDPAGNVLWRRVFGRTPETVEFPADVAIDENGGVNIAVLTQPDNIVEIGELPTSAYIKYDTDGNLKFAQGGATVGDNGGGRVIVADGRGRVYTSGDFSLFTSAFDLNGTLLWSTRLESSSDLAVTPTGDIVVGGTITSQLDRNGAILGQYRLNGFYAVSVAVDAFGSAYVAGSQEVGNGFYPRDIVTLKFSTGASTNPSPPPPPPPPLPITIPAAPTSLTATAISRSSVRLQWRDNANNEQAVHIERCSGSSRCTSFVQIADTPFVDSVVFTDSTVRSSTTYRYRIRAFNSAGNSAYSNIASVRTPFR